MLMHRLRRVRALFSDATYRRVLLARLLCALLRKLNPRLHFLGLSEGGLNTFFFLNDNAISPNIIATGSFQKDDLLRVIRLCGVHGFALGGTFVDIGANIGTTTLYAMSTGSFSRAFCVEPDPANLVLLRMNLFANGLVEKVGVRAAAASRDGGSLRLARSEENCGDHRIARGGALAERKSIEVEVGRIDAFLAEAGIRSGDVSLVWVDTQGHEGFVLAGATELLRSGIPFCVEFWPQSLHASGCYDALMELLERSFSGFVDLGKPADLVQPMPALRELARSFDGTIYHTDLFLIP